MQDTSLRWGGIIGGFGMVGGVFSYVVGGVLAPLPRETTTADAVAVMVTVRGLLALAGVGIVLGLAYYAGVRVGMDLLQHPAQGEDVPADRLGPGVAGGLWWFFLLVPP